MQQNYDLKVVFIPTSLKNLVRQTPGKNAQWGRFQFVFSGDQFYDYLVVLDNLRNPIACKVDKEHTIAFLGEPPYVNMYNNRFVRQFGQVYGCFPNKYIKTFEPNLPWMIGENFIVGSHCIEQGECMSYDDFKSQPILEEGRKNKLCVITSNKKITCGHRRRVEFVERLKQEYPDLIDVYGNGYHPIADKYEVLSKYKYALVIENCQYPNYWTEKLGDTYLAGVYPIYCGCPNINEYFGDKSYTKIDIRNYDESVYTIKQIVENDVFCRAINYLEEAKLLVMDKYNLFAIIASIIDNLDIQSEPHNKEGHMIYPLKLSILDKIRLKFARKFEIIF